MTSPTPAATARLVRPAQTATSVVTLDEHQQRVVEHPGGPLLVLAGPGTGKTTTLVEAIAHQIEHRGVHPDRILALTFSRKAAEQLRDRVTTRVGRTMSTTLASTFHSFAYALIRAYSPTELYDAQLRLLSAPEADVVLRELLRDHEESVTWPDRFREATRTRGFAREVQAVLGRAREKGLDGAELLALGRREGVPEFVAAGIFLDQYLTILDNLGATDYPDLIRRAVIEAEMHRSELRERFSHVFVDEYQDTDPGQVALLRALAGDGRNLVVVGDPHQSIYAFRGAEVRGILDFPRQFPTVSGAPAPTVVLRHTRRFGSRLLRAAGAVSSRLSLAGSISADSLADFLRPEADPQAAPGTVDVLTFDTDRAEAEHLADLLRRAHLEDGIAWDRMAVLVRSGRATLPALRRALAASGVPVEVAADELPLVRDPAVLTLLDALHAVVNLDNEDADSPGFLDPGRVEALLTSPLGGLDASDIRVLVRKLRARAKQESTLDSGTPAVPGTDAPTTSRALLRASLVTSGFLEGLEGVEVEKAAALAALLRAGTELLVARATAEEVLWQLWSETSWPSRLRRRVDQGGATARRAHRDLDAICALFESAARAEGQRGHSGVAPFLDSLAAQQIPADTLAERGVRGGAVRLLTAHRSKGLEWDLVVVAHVQQDAWPDLRRRSSLLGADRLSLESDGSAVVAEPPSARTLLMDERRLFYVACTRARRRLVVTAVRSAEDDGAQPSRFLHELDASIVHIDGRPSRPLSLGGIVAELRRCVADPDASPALRDAAARRLAALARERLEGHALAPAADPDQWWGTRRASRAEVPVRPTDSPVPISASMLDKLRQCPAAWFFEREAGGSSGVHQSANLGRILHALAERVATGDLAADPVALMTEVDKVWDRLAFRTPWSRKRERDRMQAAVARLVSWLNSNPRGLVGTEVDFKVVAGTGADEVELVGRADRIELDETGTAIVVDFKSGRRPPTGPEVVGNLQLALYQYAVDAGALDRLVGHQVSSGGAELVQLALLDGGPDAVVQAQPAHQEHGDERAVLRDELAKAAALVRAENFPARVGQHCRDCAFVAICPAKSAGSVTVG
jgi:superfamily I DNA/RNA helicase/RecB family exonuclease